MSGFLRRTKRSRAADTGETSAEQLGAGPEGARTAGSPAVDASSAKTTELPAGVAIADASGPVVATTPSADAASGTGATAAGPAAARDVVAGQDAAEGAGPDVAADRDTPAGLDPAESGAKLATGRRGRLRRRLRYLRRARELMLRDLGGLLYEVHRTGGGDVAAHTATIGGKVERLADLDAEAAAIETALGAARGPAVVFEPGIGGTCEICGELYGSAARFCSGCGSPAGATAPSTEPRPVPTMPKPPAPAASEAASQATPGDENPYGAGTPPAGDDPKPHDAATPAAGATAQPDGGMPNGRAEPGLSPDDPLAAKRSSP